MKRNIILNTSSAVLLQVISIVVNLILPRAIIGCYGSDVNGLIQSITQFLALISFAEFGIGAVIQSALYKPLVNSDMKAVSRIMTAGSKFYKRIALILLCYVAILCVAYPVLINSNFEWLFSVLLIIAISISLFSQYYFSLVRTLLLNADMHGYISYLIQIIVLTLNMIVCILLIKNGQSVIIVEFSSAIIFMIRPIFLTLYVGKNYKITFKEKYDSDPIPQKWNGVAQHISAVVLGQTDIVVLTLFSTLKLVSVYSVYSMIVMGIRSFYNSITVGLQSAFGHLWAKGNMKEISAAFSCLEVGCHLLTVFLYSCTGLLIVPFVKVYTDGIVDVNYINYPFAIVLSAAIGIQCLRTPYNIMILSSGHYKQTQKCYIVGAIINIVLSIGMVFKWNLLGVALATLVSLLYQTIWMAKYDYSKLINRKYRLLVKQFLIDIILVIIIVAATSWIELTNISYIAWAVMAIKIAVISGMIISIGAFVLYRNETVSIVKYFLFRR